MYRISSFVLILNFSLFLLVLTGTESLFSVTTRKFTLIPSEKTYGYPVKSEPDPYILRNTLLSDKRGFTFSPDAKSLSYFAILTDLHVKDEESPLGFNMFDPIIESAFRPQGKYTAHVLNRMVMTLNDLAFEFGRNFDSLIITGDMSDSAQFNEFEWFLDIMRGGKTVDPDSGVNDDPILGPNNDHNDPFYAEGLIGTNWLFTFGNHDVLVQGSIPQNPISRAIAVSGYAPHGLIPGEKAKKIAPDKKRRLINHGETISLLLRSEFLTRGHGFNLDSLANDRGYYTNDLGMIRLIVLDTTSQYTSALGRIDKHQFEFLKSELQRALVDKKLVILASHHSLSQLVGKSLFKGKLKIFTDPALVRKELFSYPNMVMHLIGHQHQNRIRAIIPEKESASNGFWEVETSSLIDWPQQGRIFELVYNNNKTAYFILTMVNHTSSGNEFENRSRKLSLMDAERLDRVNHLDGEPNDRNVILAFDIPDFLTGDFKDMPHKEITSFMFGAESGDYESGTPSKWYDFYVGEWK